MIKALIVDDDRVLADLVAFTLRREGFEIIQAHDGELAWRRWLEEQPDLLILDVNLPKLDGFTLCQRIRQQADTPIILLTVRGEEDDVVRGLGLGADDFITKPFSPRQLVARVQAVLRRTGQTPAPAINQVGQLMLDPSRRELRFGTGAPVALTPLESRLLGYMMANSGQILTIEALIQHVWGAQGGDRDMLRQLVRRLRAKMAQAGLAGESAPLIETIPGLGYGLTTPGVANH